MSGNENTKYLDDYTIPNYTANHLDLEFDLSPNKTVVVAKTQYSKNDGSENTLILDGE